MSVTVRSLNAQDVHQYWVLRLQGLTTEPDAFGESAAEHTRRSTEETATRLTVGANGFTLGAFDGGRLVGLVTLAREREESQKHSGSVVGMYVDAGYRGRGVGRTLLAELIERARHMRGLDRLTLGLNRRRTAARALYASLGFTTYGLEPDARRSCGCSVDVEHMMRPL